MDAIKCAISLRDVTRSPTQNESESDVRNRWQLGKWQVATFFVPPNITQKGVVGGGRRLHTTVTGVGIAFSAMLGVVASRRGVGIAFSAMLGVSISFSAMLGVVASCRGMGIAFSSM